VFVLKNLSLRGTDPPVSHGIFAQIRPMGFLSFLSGFSTFFFHAMQRFQKKIMLVNALYRQKVA
jgi:hypothetical protein